MTEPLLEPDRLAVDAQQFVPMPMESSASSNSQSDVRSVRVTDNGSSIGLPLETIPSEFEAAVRELKQRSRKDLQQARKHHRRALKALHEGAYDALPEETREQLTKQLHTNLKALNEALEDGTASDTEPDSDASSLFHKALTWLW